MFRYALPKKVLQNTIIPKRNFSNCCFDYDKKSDFRNEINSWTNWKIGGLAGATFFIFHITSKLTGLMYKDINHDINNLGKAAESMKVEINQLKIKVQTLESKKP